MATLADLSPGCIGFARIPGPGGVLIRFGQWALAKTLPEEGSLNHAFVVVEGGPRPRIVQAMPSGAEEIEIGMEHWTKDFVYLRPRYEDQKDPFAIGVENRSQGFRVAVAARRYVGRPYGFADYLAILGLHLGVKNGLVRRRVTSGKTLICSQLADRALTDAGYHAFTDGRLSQDVMPVELYRALVTQGAEIIRP